MTVDAERRLSLKMAMKHPWIQGDAELFMDTVASVGPSLKTIDMFFEREVSSKSLDGADVDVMWKSKSDTYNIDNIQQWLKPSLKRSLKPVRKTCSGKIVRYRFLDRTSFWTSG
jgi:hypothetical protein